MDGKPLVAIVDDDKSIRNATQDLLKAAGFSTVTFEDAESFLGSASRAIASCVVADMRMRGMTGVKLYQELVAAGHAIPTIIITAHPEELALAGAREAGITCCLIKPFTPDELLECVHEALAKSQPPRAIPKS
jgi:FixJ family two-component response regulator